MGTRKTLTGNGDEWPTFESPINLELYDAEDDEACHQKAANAATWLKERATRIGDSEDKTGLAPLTGANFLAWYDSGLSHNLTGVVAGDIVTVWVNFETIASGLGDPPWVEYRVVISDDVGSSASRATKDHLGAMAELRQFTIIAQHQFQASGNATISLQLLHDSSTSETNLEGATFLPCIERRKVDDV